jgi:hypothetical protein
VCRENKEEIFQIKKMMPGGKLPLFCLIGGSSGVHLQYVKFYKRVAQDRPNERWPHNSPALSPTTLRKLNL